MKSFARLSFLSARLIAGISLVAILSITGCSKDNSTSGPKFTPTSLPSDDTLRERIDAAIDHTLNNRTLSTQTHNAWQVIHGILPYGHAFQIEHDGQRIGALDWLLQGGALKGWDLIPGDHGVIAKLDPGSKAAQGHPDQWIGYLSQGGLDGLHGLSLDQPIIVQGKAYTIKDLLTQAEWDLRAANESCWTLMAESAYRPINYEWDAGDGQHWTEERLIAMEAGAPVVGELASCGGTHRLYGLTVALNHYMKETGKKPEELTGGWKNAYDVVQDCIHKAKAFQQPDGNFSASFFLRSGRSPEVDTTLHATGHTLEWLSVALDDEQFQQPWVTAAVARLCQLLEDNADRELDCGALYHAARGLRLYRARRFGPAENGAPEIAKAITDSPVHDGNATSSSSKLQPVDDAAPAPPAEVGAGK
jgi:hypothetical protein